MSSPTSFISLANLSASLPDGTTLFSDLNLNFGPERVGLVGRNGVGKSTLLRMISGDQRPSSGGVQRHGTTARLRQTIMQSPTDTIVDLFGVRPQINVLAKAEGGTATLAELEDADWSLPSRIGAALSRCDLDADPGTALAQLSGGQRTRAALAAAIFANPDVLLMDEPSNNLDSEGRKALIELIRSWRGGMVVASHDRAILDEMDAIVELSPRGAKRYGGSFAHFQEQKRIEIAAAQHALADAQKHLSDAQAAAQTAQERKAHKDSRARRSRGDGGQPKMSLDARKEKSEGSDRALSKQSDAQLTAASAKVAETKAHIEVINGFRMDITPTGLPNDKRLLSIDGVTAGYACGTPVIENLSLDIVGPERIQIRGHNGSGKSTLIKLILGKLVPRSGHIERFVDAAFLDQHQTAFDREESLLEIFQERMPGTTKHTAYATLARFGFRADAVLQEAKTLSGGERLRAALACALGADPVPPLLILDEPTNHLDLDGIEALERALSSYDGALIVISHDEAFIQAVAPDRNIDL